MCNPRNKYLLALLLFGSNGIVASGIALSSSQIVLFRTFFGALSLTALLFASNRQALTGIDRKEIAALAISGAALGIGWLFLFEAYTLVGVGIASLAYYCGPVLVMALSPLLFGEKLTPARIAGFCAVLIGAALVVCTNTGGALNPFGLALGLGSACMYAVMVIFSRKAPSITGLANASIQMNASFIVVGLYSFMQVMGGISFELPHDWVSLVSVLALGLINTGLGCYLYFSSIAKLPVQQVAILGYLEPLSAVVFSVLVLGEAMTPMRALGAFLIVGGAAASELMRKPAQTTTYICE
ncbi:MAG: DMT family transporter [Atopobium sp.]|uniref:DMT family transporter n=1 Tax=Atopobium sp. TaxID=1872650 RepID=UPI002A83B9BC|nr:DMT family transporter [Atopobium sp.]MDY4523333.1 DMT family transporter [Atopobium sp.]